MKNIEKIKGFSKKTLLVILGVILGAGFSVFAVGTWQGTDWIQTGEVISAEKIKENFVYLYEKIDEVGEETSVPTYLESEPVPFQSNGNSSVWKHGQETNPDVFGAKIVGISGCMEGKEMPITNFGDGNSVEMRSAAELEIMTRTLTPYHDWHYYYCQSVSVPIYSEWVVVTWGIWY